MTYKTTGTLQEIGAKVGDVCVTGRGFEFVVSNFELERWKKNDYKIVLPKSERVKGPFCAECDCVNGGSECTWIKSGPCLNRANPTGPVRTVTRKEIVPGVYGVMKISGVDDYGVNIDMIDILDKNNIDELIATLTEIRDAL